MPTPHAPQRLGRHQLDATAAAPAAAPDAPEHAPDQPSNVQRPAPRRPRGETRVSLPAVIRNVFGRLRTAVDPAVAEPLFAALADLDAERKAYLDRS